MIRDGLLVLLSAFVAVYVGLSAIAGEASTARIIMSIIVVGIALGVVFDGFPER